MNHLIRQVKAKDSKDILAIYAPYIEHTAISFETQVPSLVDFTNRIASISEQYPYLVYIIDGEIIGYAYASKHRERAAYCYDVDVSIYVLQAYHGLGIAGKLYSCLFECLNELGYYNAYAGIALPNEKSEFFHKKYGFSTVGVFHKTGYKFGKWHDIMWLQKTIREHENHPAPPASIKQLTASYAEKNFPQNG